MEYNVDRVSRFNVKVIWVLSFILTAQAFAATGSEYGVPSLIATGSTSVVVTIISYLKINFYIKGVLIPLTIAISAMGLSHLFGGMAHLFTLYLVIMCLAALYFNKMILVIFTISLFTLLVGVFIISPVSLMGEELAYLPWFADRMVQLTAGFIVLYFLMKWGNEAVDKAIIKEKEAIDLSGKLKRVAQHVEKTVDKISSDSQNLAAAAQEGNATIEVVTDLLERIDSNIGGISASTDRVSSLAKESNKKTERGNHNISGTIDSMIKINNSVVDTVEVMNELDLQANKIEDILDMIGGITKQTKLLSLNASVEAARAGNNGSSFAVVAEEIRSLAVETTKAADGISDLIQEIKRASKDGLEAIELVQGRSEEGKEIAEQSGKIFGEIKDSFEKTSLEIDQTFVATKDLSEDSKEVFNSAEEIRDMSNQITKSSLQLSNLAQELQNLTKDFV